jgi:orotidine-5'-phosphate decarboxylase
VTELIIALDCPAPQAGEIFCQLNRELDQRWFKIGPRILLDHSGMILIENMLREDVRLFFDLKIYDTRDTVTATARAAFAAGAEMLTDHATPSMLDAAMAAKPPWDHVKVLAVPTLTDNPNYGWEFAGSTQFDGIVCPAWSARWYHKRYSGKIIVSPGIRFVRETPTGPVSEDPDNHVRPASPAEARAMGTDFVVVGRPILNAADPVAAARTIMAEL